VTLNKLQLVLPVIVSINEVLLWLAYSHTHSGSFKLEQRWGEGLQMKRNLRDIDIYQQIATCEQTLKRMFLIFVIQLEI